MLVLSRKVGEQIQIGDGVTLTVLKVNGQSISVGVEAPREVRIMRGELLSGERNQSESQPPQESAPAA
ncbi:MAG: carbon storage regulator [Pirellulaceae bacterium]